MLLVYVVGGEDGGATWKLALVGIALVGIIAQYSRGRAKGKSPAEALVDDDAEEIISAIKSGDLWWKERLFLMEKNKYKSAMD